MHLFLNNLDCLNKYFCTVKRNLRIHSLVASAVDVVCFSYCLCPMVALTLDK